MKRLLLLVIVIFSFCSVAAMANYDPNTGTMNYGCGPGIPPDVCMGNTGGGGGTVYYTPTYYGAIAIDQETGAWSSASSYTSKKSARESVISRCGADCKVVNVDANRCVAIAYSASDKVLDSDSAIAAYAKIGYNTRVKRANEKALKKCEKNGGQSCKVIVNVCAIEGTTEY